MPLDLSYLVTNIMLFSEETNFAYKVAIVTTGSLVYKSICGGIVTKDWQPKSFNRT